MDNYETKKTTFIMTQIKKLETLSIFVIIDDPIVKTIFEQFLKTEHPEIFRSLKAYLTCKSMHNNVFYLTPTMIQNLIDIYDINSGEYRLAKQVEELMKNRYIGLTTNILVELRKRSHNELKVFEETFKDLMLLNNKTNEVIWKLLETMFDREHNS